MPILAVGLLASGATSGGAAPDLAPGNARELADGDHVAASNTRWIGGIVAKRKPCTDRHFCSDRPEPEHSHQPCICAEDDVNGARGHIKVTMRGHWPVRADMPIVVCHQCDGFVAKSYANPRLKAMNHEPLPT